MFSKQLKYNYLIKKIKKLIDKRERLDEELEYLKENITESNYNLAMHLKRSIYSIKSKKRFLKELKIS